MGCGGKSDPSQRRTIELSLAPVWRVLPKNAEARVEWRMVRYAVHRYFMQRSNLLIRGFEPAREVNSSHLGAAEILNAHGPSLVQQALESKAGAEGFSFDDITLMIATLERLVFDAEIGLIGTVFAERGVSTTATLGTEQFEDILKSYMIHWLLGSDQESLNYILENPEVLTTVLPHWNEVLNFTSGLMRGMEFVHHRSPSSGGGNIALNGLYRFDDVHEVVGDITRTFAAYWEAECQTVKKDLVAMDKSGTGRISLADFYGANADGEWRFGESESYLRELGALDESSSWRGKQVIIPNYLQGASNCIVATANYLVCCKNECESVLNELEDTIGGPVASPDQLLALVKNITNFDDESPVVDKSLVGQLRRIAETHGGQVPLHGRLFTQWLHYVFPRECPFPHRSGTVSSLAPTEFGEDFLASSDDVSKHAATRGTVRADPSADMRGAQAEAQWMTQWSEEEELHADYSLELRAPWDRSFRFAGFAAAVFAVLVLTGVIKRENENPKLVRARSSGRASFGGFDQKAHFV